MPRPMRHNAVALALMLLLTGVIALIAPSAQAQTAPAGPVGWYKFAAADKLGADATDHGLPTEVVAAEFGGGRNGAGITLDGTGGLQIADSSAVQVGGGFAIEMWVKFAGVAENMGLAAKEGEYLLRLDPPNEGGNLSFYVNAGGSLEPRVRGLAPKTDTWYHLIATWDGETASLWINGQQFHAMRRGAVAPTQSPALIGLPSHFGPIGFKGVIDEVRLYNRPLSDGDVLKSEYGLDRLPAGPKLKEARFQFDKGAAGWEATDARLTLAKEQLTVVSQGPSGRVLQRNLDVPLADKRFVSLRMSVSQGEEGKLLALTTQGLGVVPFALKADGAPHSYVFDMARRCDQWSGRLLALGLVPSDAPATVTLDFIRASADAEAPPEITITSFLPDAVLNRAQRACRIVAAFKNAGGLGLNLTAHLTGPAGVTITRPDMPIIRIGAGDMDELTWLVRADREMTAPLTVTVSGGGMTPTTARADVAFTPPVDLPKAAYVPEPDPAPNKYLVGCHYCPLWKQGGRGAGGWQEIEPFPERKPALGFYDENNPEVTDWEIKWATEHGIQYFVYCWYRKNQGHPVEQNLGHAIHEGLFHAKYESKFHFTIMWENQSKGNAGVASEEDFLTNLVPWWIENYFKRPSYLKVDNKPLLFIYRPEFLVDDLGGVANVKRALDKARELCKAAGFAGLTILGEYRGTDPAPLQLMVDEGLDYSFAYCWPVPLARPTAQQAMDAQESYWKAWYQEKIIPGLLTVSMGWDSTPWSTSYSIWRLPPSDFEKICVRARNFMDTLPADNLGSKLVLLDNWNEFGEGHYISPHRQYGFGYLDAVRNAFTTAPKQHTDLVPEDLGLGPYDSLYARYKDREALCHKRVALPGGEARGLIGWWTFDENDNVPVAWDYTGNGLGGTLENAQRVPGLRGKALLCDGGSVSVPRAGQQFGLAQMTVECWLKTDLAGQNDKWFVNNLYGSGGSGFRFGLAGGKLSFAIPVTGWSHHFAANEPLPLGRWVHVAATYDGQMMRIYMDGKEVGSLQRTGRVHPNNEPLCLGNYDPGHAAHFTGLLDEVKIWSRALTADEIAARAKG